MSRGGVILPCFCVSCGTSVLLWQQFHSYSRPERDLCLVVVSFCLVFASFAKLLSRSSSIFIHIRDRSETNVSRWRHFALFLRPLKDFCLAAEAIRLIFAATANFADITGLRRVCLRRRRGWRWRCGPRCKGAGPRSKRTTWRRSCTYHPREGYGEPRRGPLRVIPGQAREEGKYLARNDVNGKAY